MKTTQHLETTIDFKETVLYELAKILTHPRFVSSGVLSRFLHFVVNETLAGRQQQIKEYTIALEVLRRPSSFEPAYDAIVRVHAKRLRDSLIAYYDEEGSQDNFRITVPKGRYIPLFEKLGVGQIIEEEHRKAS